MLAKGRQVLGDMWSLLVRFRNYDLGLIGYVSKAYYAMKMGQLEKHVRRVVWRWGDCEQDWRTFAFVAVSFGDRPAATLLHICVNRCLSLFKKIDIVAAERVKHDNFVDEIITGGTAATDSPQLVVFWDGNNSAFFCTIYTRGPLGNRTKVAPKYGTSTPRMELNGAQFSMRATLAVVKALSTTLRTRTVAWTARPPT